MAGAPEGIEWGGLPEPALVRATVGLVAGLAVSLVGAKMMGEYQFDGALPYIAGVLFGLVVAEVVVEIGRRRTLPVALATGAWSAIGLLWAGYIASGDGLEPLKAGVWIAGGLGFLAAAGRTYERKPGAYRSTTSSTEQSASE